MVFGHFFVFDLENVASELNGMPRFRGGLFKYLSIEYLKQTNGRHFEIKLAFLFQENPAKSFELYFGGNESRDLHVIAVICTLIHHGFLPVISVVRLLRLFSNNEFFRPEMTSDPSTFHGEYSIDGSYSLFQFEQGSDAISVFKNSIEHNFVFFKCLFKLNRF